MAGFTFAYRLSGGAATLQTFKSKDTETLTVGDTVNLESGELDLGAAGDSNFVGVIVGFPGSTGVAVAATDSTTDVQAITDDDAVYSVVDAAARAVGATLDISGNTGAQTVTTSSGKEFIVVAASTASQPTLVRFNTGKHFKNKAQ